MAGKPWVSFKRFMKHFQKPDNFTQKVKRPNNFSVLDFEKRTHAVFYQHVLDSRIPV